MFCFKTSSWEVNCANLSFLADACKEQIHLKPVCILTKPLHQLEPWTEMSEYLLGPLPVTHFGL